MIELNQLIKKYGHPDALIDHWDSTSKRYAIWGFDEEYLINYNGIAIVNGSPVNDSPIQIFQETLNRWKTDEEELTAVGYISYDFKNIIFPHIKFKQTEKLEPLLWFGKPRKVISYDITESHEQEQMSELIISKDLFHPEEYEKYIHIIKEYLEKGDSYQINFTQPKKYQIFGDPFDLYMSMREYIQPYCGMYLYLDNMHILSYSPERFFRTSNGIIESFPMKGTRPRSDKIIKDERLAEELYLSEKDRAEHLMIVDLIRNDIGKVCEYGSMNVENLYGIESFKTVHQMVSRIYGKLNNGIQETDIIQALFPGGSITGAPKEESMKIIDSLENYQRGIYTGALGSISSNGNMDFNISIRTMIIEDNIATYPVGGGIVWDSNPLEEWQEAQQKSKIIDLYQNNFIRERSELESCANT